MRAIRALVLAPFLWCCAQHPMVHTPPPVQQPVAGVPMGATVALETNDSQIYCAGVWVGPVQVLTAHHCIRDLESKVAQVEDADGHKFAMGVVLIDPRVDLALLAAPFAPEHATASLATSWSLGEHLTIVGHPGATPWVVKQGWIAHEEMRNAPHDDGTMRMLWVQAPIWYGNSGGGAFDDQGHLVGICSMLNTIVPDQGWFVSPEEIHGFLAKAK